MFLRYPNSRVLYVVLAYLSFFFIQSKSKGLRDIIPKVWSKKNCFYKFLRQREKKLFALLFMYTPQELLLKKNLSSSVRHSNVYVNNRIKKNCLGRLLVNNINFTFSCRVFAFTLCYFPWEIHASILSPPPPSFG